MHARVAASTPKASPLGGGPSAPRPRRTHRVLALFVAAAVVLLVLGSVIASRRAGRGPRPRTAPTAAPPVGNQGRTSVYDGGPVSLSGRGDWKAAVAKMRQPLLQPATPNQPPTGAAPRREIDVAATDGAGAGDDDGESPASPPPPGGTAGYEGATVNAAEDLVDGAFYMFQDATSGQFLSRALDTNAVSSFPREKIFRLAWSAKYAAFAVKGHTRMHLTNELSNKVTVDRPWARGYEQFSFVVAKKKHIGALNAGDGKLFLIKSLRNNKYLSPSSKDPGGLVAEHERGADAIKWRITKVTSCRTEAACWGEETAFGASPGGASEAEKLPRDQWPKVKRAAAEVVRRREQSIMQRLAAAMPFPIVGSPKPLKAVVPLKDDDGWDAVRISTRAMKNWASIPGLVPLQLTDDPNTMRVIQNINANVTRTSPKPARGKKAELRVACALTKVKIDTTFENHPKYKQPTYRGLFKRGLELFPAARGVMFSNGDILYTPSLTQTIQRVIEFLDAKKAKFEAEGKHWHDRWMIVGQRINHEVPARWTMEDPASEYADDANAAACDHGFPQWVHDIEGYAAQGDIFQSDAEDFFIVSRNMFNWDEIPDFVVGGVAFDNWIVAKAARMAINGDAFLVDGTKTITALHQNHGPVKGSHDHPKSIYNSHLAAQNGGIGALGHTADAPIATERRQDGSITVYDKHRLMFS